MRKPIREDDEELAKEWPILQPTPMALSLDEHGDSVVLLLASTRKRGALYLGVGVAGVLASLAVAALVDLGWSPAVLLLVLCLAASVFSIVVGWPLVGRPHGEVLVDTRHVEIRHPGLVEAVSFPLDAVHSMVKGPVPIHGAGPFAKLEPAAVVGRLPRDTPWVQVLARVRRPADLLLVVVPPVPIHARAEQPIELTSGKRPVRGFALHLAEPGMADVALPQVFGHRLVDGLAEDAWAYLVQDDKRFTQDPVFWARTRDR